MSFLKKSIKISFQRIDFQDVIKKFQKSEKYFKKVLEGKEKDVPLHSQNNGNGAEENERDC